MIFMKTLIEGETHMAKKVDAEYYRQLEQIQAADFVLVEPESLFKYTSS